MSIKPCPTCGAAFNANMSTARRSAKIGLEESICDNCFDVHVSGALLPNSLTPGKAQMQGSSRVRRSAAAEIAIKSARIVNAYGRVIQVIGIMVGVLAIIGGFVLAHNAGSSLIALGGLVIRSLDIAIFAVQGALFRMISNYVIAKLE